MVGQGLKGVAQLIENFPTSPKSCVVMRLCHLSIQEMGAEGAEVQSHSQIRGSGKRAWTRETLPASSVYAGTSIMSSMAQGTGSHPQS